MKIENVTVNGIFDSRGERTIEVVVESDSQKSMARIPLGKSRGKREAVVISPERAKEVLEGGLGQELELKEFNSTKELDDFLLVFDGTKNKSKIGGNLSLGISIAFARAIALKRNQELWEVLREEFFSDVKTEKSPAIFSNMINGGAHADNNLDIQEYQVITKEDEPTKETIKILKGFYKKLGEHLKDKFELDKLKLGDEKGYTLDFPSNEEPIKILKGLISESGLEGKLSIGIDAAANSFQEEGMYRFGDTDLDRDELLGIYEKYLKDIGLLMSIEDPFGEDDKIGFEKIKKLIEPGKLIIGDDLTATNPGLIDEYGEYLINSVIIKPNQVGTVTETCLALSIAKDKGLYRIVSHRSGEVDDAFLVHFAKAAGAEGVKIGAPAEERLVKFEELAKIY